MSCNWLSILCVNAVLRGQKKTWWGGGMALNLAVVCAPCTNVGELVLAVLQYCVCSLEGVGLFVQGLQVSLVHPLSMCPSFCHFISTQLRCVSKCARPHSRSKPVASLFVGGLQSNSKCVHPLQQTTHMFQACSAKIVSRASMSKVLL